MSLEAENIDDEAFKNDDEDFSYASKDLGSEMQKDLKQAKERNQQRIDMVTGTTKSREKRIEARLQSTTSLT
jgi:hypothetical protein